MAKESSFIDLFSGSSGQYSQRRPQYPPELFDFLAEKCASRDLCWDCGCGNGQASVALADHFRRVVATDASAQQIGHCAPRVGVEYRVERAEQSGLPDHCADLVTVATAAHWFDLEGFYREVRRVAKDGAVLALWTYCTARVRPEIDAVLGAFYALLEPHWHPATRCVRNAYRDLPFPFEALPGVPSFSCRMSWSLEEFLGFLGTSSSIARYKASTSQDPLEPLRQHLGPLWSHKEEVLLPLHIKVGTIKL
eukprot:TRINITY_DN494_c0_g1_i1.p1 TRINITY_DN494_c0_g1~~TRINITY_DN494_c0_g1_i1.p1  ORF type:complete len:272 (-),score=7.85 TRINITY_DN494_c0_g1_i1:141-893(-)